MMKTETLLRAACAAILAAVGAALVLLLFRYGIGILLPFLIAFLISAAVRGTAGWLKRKTGLHSAAGNLMVLLLLMALTVGGCVWLGSRLVRQAGELIRAAGVYLDNPDNFLHQAAERLDAFTERWHPRGEGDGIGAAVYQMINEVASRSLSSLTASLAAFAGGILTSLPGTLVGVVIGLIALFYLCLDYKAFRRAVAACLPPRLRQGGAALRARLKRLFGRYVRAYLLLFLITFAELLLGLTVLGVRYAVVGSLLTALVDILPVFGVGTVLVPWGAVCLLSGNYYRGIGLLILFGVMYAVRQVAEPKLVGKCMGIHPLTALLAVYAGYRLFGVGGMILGPVAAYFVKWALGGAEPEAAEKPETVPSGGSESGKNKRR